MLPPRIPGRVRPRNRARLPDLKARPAMKQDNQDSLLREQLVAVLDGGHAHATFDQAVKDFPAEFRGKKAKGLPHTAWMLLEHLRIAQSDILEFSRNPKHVSPEWPAGYWPKKEEPPSPTAWDKSIKAFQADLKAMQDLVKDSKTDLFAKIAWGDGQTILREALLTADHNAYHIAQLVDLRRLLGIWKES